MTDKVIIDRERCDGCGLCVSACHEGAMGMVDGKAAVVDPNLCDGLGSCLPACPRGAITIVKEKRGGAPIPVPTVSHVPLSPMPGVQWPIQLGLVPTASPAFKGTVTFAADCTGFVTDGLRSGLAEGGPIVICCPKLDDSRGLGKISDIIQMNPIGRVRVIRMEVPCCSALTSLVKKAVESCGRDVGFEEIVLRRDGSRV